MKKILALLMTMCLMCATMTAQAITFEQIQGEADTAAETEAPEETNREASAADKVGGLLDAIKGNQADSPETEPEPAEEPEATMAPTDGKAHAPEENVLMWVGYGDELFDTGMNRSDVSRVVFLDSLADMPGNAWDVSEYGNGKVMAWTIAGSDGYELYIAGEGGVRANENSGYLFSKFTNVKSIDFGGCFDTSDAVSLDSMFYGCEMLESVNLSGFDTAGVENFSDMFYECTSLESLDVSGFDTANGRDFSRMFRSCECLTTLDVSGFDTGKAEKMTTMFGFCYELTALDVSNFDTSNVTDMGFMFCLLKRCTELDVSSFDTSNVTKMNDMFYGCCELTSLDVSGFDTARVTTMEDMFASCKRLETLDVSGFSTASLEDATGMFDDCDRLSDNIGDRFSGIAPTPAPTVKPTAKPAEKLYPTLERGDYGEQVKSLQQKLIQLGYLASNEADGSYGAKTGKAVHRFKEMNGIWHSCSDTEYCKADSEMQNVLYGGSAQRWEEPDVALEMPAGSYGQWNYSGSKLNFRMEVSNSSAYRTVKAFEAYVYVTDVWGDRIWGENNVKTWTSEVTVKPGAVAYSSYAALPDASDIYEVHVAIKRVRYSDGTVAEVPDYDLNYTWWTID